MAYVDFIRSYIQEMNNYMTAHNDTTSIKHIEPNHNKKCIILGANTVLGYDIALNMSKNGYNILLTCDDKQEMSKLAQSFNISAGNIYYLNLSDYFSLNDFAKSISNNDIQLDIIINTVETIDGNYNNIFRTNYENPVYLLSLLNKCITPNTKIINITSSLYMLAQIPHDLDFFNKTSIYNAYFLSKLFNILYMHHMLRNNNSQYLIINSHYVNIKNLPFLFKLLTLFNQSTHNAALQIMDAISNEETGGLYDNRNNITIQTEHMKDMSAKLVQDTNERKQFVNYALYLTVILNVWIFCIMFVILLLDNELLV